MYIAGRHFSEVALPEIPVCMLFIIRYAFIGHNMADKYVKVREYRRCNNKWIIQRNWQHRIHRTKTNKTKTQH
jgi:hypothetical protein